MFLPSSIMHKLEYSCTIMKNLNDSLLIRVTKKIVYNYTNSIREIYILNNLKLIHMLVILQFLDE